jgi:hypothetical protein
MRRPAAYFKRESRKSAVSADWHGLCSTSGMGATRTRSKAMEKVETFAFLVGFALTGFLSFVVLPLA